MSKEKPTIGFIAAMDIGDIAHLIVPSNPSIEPFSIRLTNRLPPKGGRASPAYRFTDAGGTTSITCFDDGHLTCAPEGLNGHIAILNCVEYKHIRVVKPIDGTTINHEFDATVVVADNLAAASIAAMDIGGIAYLIVPGDISHKPIAIRLVYRSQTHGEPSIQYHYFDDAATKLGSVKCGDNGEVFGLSLQGSISDLNGVDYEHMRVVLDNPAVVDGTIAGLAFGDIAYLTVPQCPVHSPIAVRLATRTWPPSMNGAPVHHFTDVDTTFGIVECGDDGTVLAIKLKGGMSELEGVSCEKMRVVMCKTIRTVKHEFDATAVESLDAVAVKSLVAAASENYTVTSILRNDPEDTTVKPITKEQAEIRKLQETIQAMNIERENLQATIQANAEEILAMRGELLDAHDIALHVEPGYLQLANILRGALQQAQHGKGAERHADDKPFHQQPIIAINEILGSVDGLAYQVIKKVKESKGLPTLDAKLREIYGAINYAAAMAIMYRNAETGEADDE